MPTLAGLAAAAVGMVASIAGLVIAFNAAGIKTDFAHKRLWPEIFIYAITMAVVLLAFYQVRKLVRRRTKP